MFIELFSDDVVFHGDGESVEAKVNISGWPFNLDLSEAPESQLSAYEVLGGGGVKVGTFTVSTQDDRILVPAHGLVNGEEIYFMLDDPMSCALPTPLVEEDPYIVLNARGNDFQVTTHVGGPVVILEDRGTGTNEVWKGGSGGETLEALECEQDGSYVTIRFPELIAGGESKTVRLRAKVFV